MSVEDTYRDLFIAESRENHENVVNNLLVLENGADDDAIDEIFRSAHTLKGMSASMGYDALEHLTHSMEDVFHLIRSGKLEIQNELVTLLLSCTDLIEEMLDNIEDGKEISSEESSALIERLHELTDTTGMQCTEDNSVEESDIIQKDLPVEEISDMENLNLISDGVEMSKYHITVFMSESCDMNGIRAMIALQNLEELGTIVSTVPSREKIEDSQFSESFEVTVVTDAGEDAIITVVSGPDIEHVSISTVEKSSEPETVQPPKQSGKRSESDKKEKNREIKNIRVDLDKLDHMMNLVEDLVINRGRLVEIAQNHQIKEFDEALNMVGRSVTDLQDLMMEIRMIPLSHIFNRLPRVVRDVANYDGKEVEFLMSGGETELDRSVIDGLSDPLLHIIRNAVNHGIELPEARINLGKTRKGLVQIGASRDKDNVIIVIEDDGAGINVRKLKTKAVEKGLMTEEEAEKSSDEEMINILFRPGFSTAEKITDISGRGVGLDVVKGAIESLNGTVKVDSTLGKGSRWELVLPPTMAIVDVMMSRINGKRCAIPTNNVVEIAAVKAGSIKKIGKSEAVLLRDEVLPLYRLDDMFGLSENGETIIVVQSNDKKFCILVDIVEGQQEVVVKPLSKFLGICRGVNGVTIPGDGEVVPVLDINTVI